MTQRTKQAANLPKLMGTLKSGFDLTTRHWWLGVLPFIVDVSLWLGVRLSYQPVYESLFAMWQTRIDSAELSSSPAQLEQFNNLLVQSNLLGSLSVPLFGIPTLLGSLSQNDTPLPTQTIYIERLEVLSISWLLISVFGIFLSNIYFYLIARTVQGESISWRDFGRTFLPNMLRLMLLTSTILFVLIGFLTPLLTAVWAIGMRSVGLAAGVMIGSLFIIMWGAILLSFTVQAMYLSNLAPLSAIRASLQFIQQHSGRALPFLLIVLLITNTTADLWLRAYDGSWLVLVSLAGHAFIATALVAATFIFYQDLKLTPEPEVALGQ